MQFRFAAIPIVIGALFSTPIQAKDAAEQVKVAVMEFASKGGVTQVQMDALGDMLATEIRSLGHYKVIGKSDIKTILKVEDDKQLLGCDDVNCIAEIGGALGVRWVVAGNISRFGEVYLLNIKLLDVEKIAVAGSLFRKIEGGEAALIDALSEVSKALFKEAEDKLLGVQKKPQTDKPDPGLATKPDPEPETGTGVEATAEAPGSPYSTWGHVAVWSGVGLLALGGVGAGLASSAASDYEGGDVGAWDTSRTWTGVMYAGFGVGAALVATGVVLWLLPTDEEPPATAAAGPTADGQGLVISIGGRW